MRSLPNIRLVATSETAAPMQAMAAKLRDLFQRLDTPNTFTEGQIVVWKQALKNRTFPEYGEPVIVTAIMPSPVFDPNEASASSPYFQEPLTLVIGIFRDNDLLEFRVDGRRFEPVTE